MASKGLGLVYEKCTKEQKDELVSILVETLTTGKRFDICCNVIHFCRTVPIILYIVIFRTFFSRMNFRPKQEVTGETKLFEEGALGKTPDGYVFMFRNVSIDKFFIFKNLLLSINN